MRHRMLTALQERWNASGGQGAAQILDAQQLETGPDAAWTLRATEVSARRAPHLLPTRQNGLPMKIIDRTPSAGIDRHRSAERIWLRPRTTVSLPGSAAASRRTSAADRPEHRPVAGSTCGTELILGASRTRARETPVPQPHASAPELWPGAPPGHSGRPDSRPLPLALQPTPSEPGDVWSQPSRVARRGQARRADFRR